MRSRPSPPVGLYNPGESVSFRQPLPRHLLLPLMALHWSPTCVCMVLEVTPEGNLNLWRKDENQLEVQPEDVVPVPPPLKRRH